MKRVAGGRGWAYTGLLLGGGFSIAANIAHSYVPPAGAAAGWAPHAGAVVSAVVWPVFLFVAIEILARADWPTGFWWGALRYGGLLPVALVAAGVSYQHLSGLLAFYGENHLTALFGPLAVDGLMVMATGALIATSSSRRPPAAEGDTHQTRISDEPVSPGPAVDGDVTEALPARPKRATPAPKAAAVAKAAKKLPRGTPAQIAALAGASEATARRVLRDRDGYGRDAAAMAGDWPVRVNGSATVGG